MLFAKPPCSIVLLPFSAILTNLILFIFHVQTLLYYFTVFTVKPFCNLSFLYLCLLVFNPIWGAMCLVEHTHNGGTPSWSV